MVSYQVELIEEKNFLKGIVSGHQTSIENEKLLHVLLGKCRELNLDRFLLDMTGLVGQPGTFSDFQLANLAVEKALPDLKKIALVSTPENFEFTQFFETVSSNRGLNVRAFIDMDKALAWINEG